MAIEMRNDIMHAKSKKGRSKLRSARKKTIDGATSLLELYDHLFCDRDEDAAIGVRLSIFLQQDFRFDSFVLL